MLSTISIATSCLTETWYTTEGTTKRDIILGNPDDPNCWLVNRDLTTTISPAICPYGYTSACDISNGSRRDPSETVWACCPSQFSCDAGRWSCAKNIGASLTYILNTTNIFGDTITTQLVGGAINAHSIRVAFHSSDILDQFTSTTDSVINSISTSSTPTSTSSNSPIVPDRETLPTGAWIGIGIAITIGAVIIASSIFVLVRRRHGNKQQPLTGIQEVIAHPPEPKHNSATEIFSIVQPSELNGARGLYELDVNRLDNTSANKRQVA
ncbi:hypothetical protein GGR51DRAFT_524475 [Nemania sp. FL0031]|nr:hypothetical protein GGR51DRAFT_524475 [Nemania sp. FL0031]